MLSVPMGDDLSNGIIASDGPFPMTLASPLRTLRLFRLRHPASNIPPADSPVLPKSYRQIFLRLDDTNKPDRDRPLN